MPKLPTKEKGAKLAKFFKRHKGKSMVDVMAIKTVVLEAAMPMVANKLTKVSPKIMLYAKSFIPN